MKTAQRVLVLALIASLAFTTVRAQTSDAKYFAETGHWVTGNFWKYYQSVSEPEFIFGYPLTEAYTDKKSGLLVQYFQRARFEFHPELASSAQVVLTPIGQLLHTPSESINNSASLFSCRAYEQTGFSVCYAFLDFFDKYGGEKVFGYPVSNFEIYNGRIVQYFQNARLEWFPEMPEGQKVSIANLGRTFFDKLKEDAQLLSPAENNVITGNAVLELKVRAFVLKAVAVSGDKQVVYIVVQDQTYRAVKNASGVATINWAEGDAQRISFVTNENGVGVITFDVRGQTFGSLISITANTQFQNLTGKAVASFRVWR